MCIRDRVSTASPIGQAFSIGWGATFFYTTVFSFLCLLNVDAVTPVSYTHLCGKNAAVNTA